MAGNVSLIDYDGVVISRSIYELEVRIEIGCRAVQGAAQVYALPGTQHGQEEHTTEGSESHDIKPANRPRGTHCRISCRQQ
jgi:hypothetical protein